MCFVAIVAIIFLTADFRSPNGDIGTIFGDISRTAVAIYAIESGLNISSVMISFFTQLTQ